MNRRLLTRWLATVLLAAPALVPALVAAQTWPDKPIKLVIPYPPGASTDVLGRLVAQRLSATLGQAVVVENRGGASGNIGAEMVAKAAPDGYTILLGTDATHGSNMHMLPNPPYHPVRDFTPLSLAVVNPVVLVVHPTVPAQNLRELIAHVKANPGQGIYGTSGNGSPHHLAGELLKKRSGAPLVNVPYKGGGPALNDVMGGQIPMAFSSAITVLPHIQSGKLRAIAVTDSHRYEGLPSTPTIGETYEGYEMSSWLSFFGPARLPEAIATRLGEAINASLREPDTKTRLVSMGLIVVAGSGSDLGVLVRREFEERGRLIREGNIKAE